MRPLSEKVQLMFAAAIRCSLEKGEDNDALAGKLQSGATRSGVEEPPSSQWKVKVLAGFRNDNNYLWHWLFIPRIAASSFVHSILTLEISVYFS